MRTRVVLAVAVVVAAGAVIATRDDGPPLPRPAPLTTYRVRYAITLPGAGREVQEVAVYRPFLSRSTTTRDGAMTRGTISNGDGVWSYSVPADRSVAPGWLLVDGGARLAADDAQLLDVFGVAIERGLATYDGTDTVANRRCWKVRTRDPVGATLRAPTARDYTDFCVDATGVVLRERWVLKGRVVRTRVATRFEANPRPDDAGFVAEPRLTVDDPSDLLLSTLVPLNPAQRKNVPVQIRRPRGYTETGSFLLDTGDRATAAVIRFSRGPSLLELVIRTRSPRDEPPGEAIEIEGVGQARLHLVAGISELHVLAEGYVATLRGTDPDELLDAAAGLRRGPALLRR